jgi:ribosomal protein S18 acetylase RimI-like enzyme
LIEKVISTSLIETTSQLAYKIWNQHYVSIIGQAQVDYMLDKFQSPKAISNQIENGYDYFIIFHQNKPYGYLALVSNTLEKKMMISKIYMDTDFRGLGLGSKLMDFSIETAKQCAFESIWLTVNKNNSKSIEWYESKGFSIKENIKIDIGNGFIMDDYLMEMPLTY